MDVSRELSYNQTLLLLVSDIDYNNVIVSTVKKLSQKSVCYITLNKTYDSLKELFKKNNVNIKNLVFIDAISKTFKKSPKQTDNCYYIDSPGALTELSLTISKFLKHKFEYLIFDSLTNLMIYSKKEPVLMFISDLINKVKETETKAVFYALKIKEQEAMIKQCSMFADKVVDLSKK